MRDDLRIDWTIPATPAGWEGGLERFMGPGRSRVELAVELGGGAVTAGLLGLLIWRGPERDAWSWPQTLVVVLIALDLVGGVLTNATNAAKRWYHRDANPWPRLGFVASHLLHLTAVGLLLLGQDWTWSLSNAVLLLGSAVLIERIPAEGKRPVAMAAFMVALIVNLALFPLPPSLAWIPPLFYLKLLVGHLVPEAPLYRRDGPRGY
ncbi:hypothetical protein LY474_22315 [Myxococcus stipitatus]|uniref:hypothetical protein n=1 Tax=Myxococcus stipitatus TaxID=83455 RepID=UPI001F2BF28C|nr:hypothetical protein [Myxococcus stipitatus]MCE9670543.1 hypothetical protein [Myxococcus stipitatus]